MAKVDLKTLADELGLSVSTVSRALSNKPDIGVKTKNMVLTLARERNYQPNAYARSLRYRKSKTIAVVLPEIANNFFSQVIEGIEEVAAENEYHVLVYLTHESLQKEINIVRHLQSGRVDGVLISISSETVNVDHLNDIRNMGLPLVFFDRISKKLKTPSVTTNNYEGGIQATMHLIEAGSKKPAYFSLSQNLSINQNRMKGYLDALEKKGMPNCTYILQGGNDHEVNVGIMSKLLKSSDRPDGVFACVEELAIATYEACSSVGLRIPEDVKVVCFSNLHTASLLQPSLTTIRQPAFEIGKAAAIILFNLLESNEKIEYSNEKKIIDSILVKRNSTAVH